MIALRPYQLNGVEQTRAQIRAGRRRILLVCPTGGGKTVIAAHIVSSAIQRGTRVLFVAHRRELIKQTLDKLVRNGIPPELVGIIMAGVSGNTALSLVDDSDQDCWTRYARRRPTAPVQIASIDTLRNRAKPPTDLVIVDEAHRALARSYRDLQAEYPQAVHLGLTATPYRADGKGLGEVYDELVPIATPRALIDDGFLVEPRVFTVPAKDLPDLSGVKVKGGDYDETALAIAVDQAGLVGNIVEHWHKLAYGVRTVVFAVSVAHSKNIAERFRAAGVAAEHLDGETPTAERDAILARLERGETTVVVNCGVLCEGWDQPAVKCCILARPTKSTALYLQQAGRILRPFEGQSAVILDHAGCAIEHGLPQDDREYALHSARRSRTTKSVTPIRTCESCYAVLPAATRVCPECLFVFDTGEGKEQPEEQEGQLIEVRPATVDEKRLEWERLCALAQDRGYKAGWVFHRYREKFGVNPPTSWKMPELERREYSEEEKDQEYQRLLSLSRQRGYKLGWVFKTYQAKFGEAPRVTSMPAHEPNEEVVPWSL